MNQTMSNDNSTCLSNTCVPGMGYTVSRVFTTVLQVGYFSQFTDVEIETVSSRLAPLCELGTKLSNDQCLRPSAGQLPELGWQGRALCGARSHGSGAAGRLGTKSWPKPEGLIESASWGTLRLWDSFPQMEGLFRTEQITAVWSATFCFPHVALHLMSVSGQGQLLGRFRIHPSWA